ncbi:MAG: hypothetical protein QOH41_3860 [Blastocatellia bacterium]|nr:hypothetical protein [Blastocatellia bacterium]
MTNSTTTATHRMIGVNNRISTRRSDEAPMVITRLSGWIEMGELKSAAPAWIVPTRMHAPAR